MAATDSDEEGVSHVPVHVPPPRPAHPTTTATVAALWVYPVKGCAGIPLERADVALDGFRYDRHWLVVAADGAKLTFLTQRQHPTLCLVRTRTHPRTHAPT
jgi:uncharacterized protein YcbX